MTVGDKQLTRLGGWPAGIDNRSKETEVSRDENGKMVALREAVNVDLTTQGTPTTRPGYRKVVACSNGHSLWRDGLFPFALFVDSGTMYGMETGGNPFDVRAGLAPRPVSYAHVASKAYWSNGQDSGVVDHDGGSASWGVESPAGQPACSAATPGDKRWQVAITYRRADGEESGTGIGVLCLGADDTQLNLSGIPQPAAPDIIAVRVYVTPPDGDVFYFNRDIPVGMSSVTINPGSRKKALETQFLDPMPAGEYVRALNGRLYVLRRDTLFWSEALRYGLCSLEKNRIRVGAGGTLLQGVGDGGDGAGLYVADGKRTYWFGGSDPARFTRQIVAQHAAIPGTGLTVQGSIFGLETTLPVAYWINTQGTAIVGLPGGQLMPLREKNTASPLGERGASLLREHDGYSRIVTSLKGATVNKITVGDRVSARVYRNGVEID